MNDQADIALIAACQQGDARAFKQVFDLYRDRVYSLCRHMSGNSEDAEDLTQEVFVRAFKNIAGFRAESSFGTWIYRIAVNCCRQSSESTARPSTPWSPWPKEEPLCRRKRQAPKTSSSAKKSRSE